MAYTTIKKPSDYFNTKLYTGTGSSQSITGVGFQPDWTWIKNRDLIGGYGHSLFDSVRGVNKRIRTITSSAEDILSDSFNSFNSDGFTLGADSQTEEINRSSASQVSWNWKANGTGSANTDGTISSTVSANTTAGFSIVSYTGTGSAATIGHGLGAVPKMIIIKRLNGTADWIVGHQEADTSNPWNKYLQLNDPTPPIDRVVFNDTAPTNSVFSVGADILTNTSGGTYIAYCFAEKQGFSKFGSYTGNGSTDGTFVYTGFKPAFVMHKRIDSTSEWFMFDNKRLGYNSENYRLMANLSNAEADAGEYDLLSNGFKIRITSGNVNGSGATYIYMAFAEQPLVGDNPATAR